MNSNSGTRQVALEVDAVVWETQGEHETHGKTTPGQSSHAGEESGILATTFPSAGPKQEKVVEVVETGQTESLRRTNGLVHDSTTGSPQTSFR